MLPPNSAGSGLGPRSFAAVTAALAEADASVAMVYLMHICAVATNRRPLRRAPRRADIARDRCRRHLSTLAISESGFAQPFLGAGPRARAGTAPVFTGRREIVRDQCR